MSKDSNNAASGQIGEAIVNHSRDARFADTGMEEWAERLRSLIDAQPDISEVLSVTNVRRVGEAAGGSNGTLLFDAKYSQNGQTVERGFVLRFLPAEGLFHEYNIAAQYNLQKALGATLVPVPEMVWIDEAGEHLVSPGYVMSQVPGSSAPMVWKASGLIAEASPQDRRVMTTGFIHGMADVHKVDLDQAGLGWLRDRASGDKLIDHEINWYWDAMEWRGNQKYIDQLKPVKDWLIENEPDGLTPVLCHGDSNLGNYMFNDGELSAVVDWEMSFIGTPECDLSFFAIGDGVFAGDPPEGALTIEEMLAEYESFSGHKLENMDYFNLFSSYRVAVINVLCMEHFPEPVLEMVMPTLEAGIAQCVNRAASLGI